MVQHKWGTTVNQLRFLARILLLILVLGLFFLSIEMMGDSFKLFGKDTAKNLLGATSNPLVGLFVGILATTLVQSSSTTTSIVVGMVGAGMISVSAAIPIIMGANIGTSVTNTIVSLGHITRRQEFRRALAGATVHDFFNFAAVLILFPLELLTGYLNHLAHFAAGLLGNIGGLQYASPVKIVIKPVSNTIIHLFGDNGILTLLLALVLLFISLKLLVSLLKTLILQQAEQFIHQYIFRVGLTSMLFGCLVTIMVQSSSVTTSLAVPLVGAGILTLQQIFPYTLGANIGTTVTAMLAALLTQRMEAVVVAFAHLFFNLTGVLIIYPIPQLRRIPLWLAERFGEAACKHRAYAIVYVLVVFYIVPVLLILIERLL